MVVTSPDRPGTRTNLESESGRREKWAKEHQDSDPAKGGYRRERGGGRRPVDPPTPDPDPWTEIPPRRTSGPDLLCSHRRHLGRDGKSQGHWNWSDSDEGVDCLPLLVSGVRAY